jgi:rod shape determining protein RodA
MWNHKYLFRIDLKVVFTIFSLMIISLLIISSMTGDGDKFLTMHVKHQMERFLIGWGVFLFFVGFDYRKLKDFSWVLYFLMVVLLLGLYFANPIQSVHRWYRLPIIGINVQPSEYAKLIVVICLGWFLEKKGKSVKSLKSAFQVGIIAFLPFFLILKQPDLGTALIFYPITLFMCFFGGINKKVLKAFSFIGILGLIFIFLIFSGILPHEKAKPFFTSFMKEYQYNRLNPNTYHQRSAKIAIAIGGLTGSGWKKSEFSSKKWLPASHTDSVFAAFGEEFGLLGLLVLLLLFYALIYFSFRVINQAKDHFGRLLASGIAVYLAMHIIVNIAMMCGFLPISGVPLVLVTYGGSSVVMSMAALGILQSIYTRRFMF